ncbi:Hpt domain-containing protein [uncultured Kordia sp.]|uniref:Hpt domain-containing protein n=1 Tax=uncultured Kordia sp. TaxID=507699 RepID=UPI00261DD5BC|nr:Hpt domain-containing protein [uncultured Kordia sp.]
MQLDTPNLSYIHMLSDGDKEFEASMIAILKRELPIEKAAFVESILDKNYKISAEHVHKIKHKISILGLVKSYEFAVSFEESLKEEDSSGYDMFMKILQNMENFLTKI